MVLTGVLSNEWTSEKRKVDSSILSLTTTTDLQDTVPHLHKRSEAPFFVLRLAMAVHGWQRQLVPNTRPSQLASSSPSVGPSPSSQARFGAGPPSLGCRCAGAVPEQ